LEINQICSKAILNESIWQEKWNILLWMSAFSCVQRWISTCSKLHELRKKENVYITWNKSCFQLVWWPKELHAEEILSKQWHCKSTCDEPTPMDRLSKVFMSSGSKLLQVFYRWSFPKTSNFSQSMCIGSCSS
jgi:hypothetical protein